MKKVLALFLTTILCIACMATMFACKKEVHEHTYSSEWSYDETDHWYAANCEHSDEVSGKSSHTWGEAVVDKYATVSEEGQVHRLCTVCGAKSSYTIPKSVYVKSSEVLLAGNGGELETVEITPKEGKSI